MSIKTYLFDLDDTLINTKIYADIYQPVLELIKSKRKFTDKQIDQKAIVLGLEKNQFNRWDTGDLCKKLGLLDEYYLLLEEQIHVQSVLHLQVINIFDKLKKDNNKIAIVSNSMLRTINAYINRYKLNKYVDFIFSSDDAGCKKDHVVYWEKLIQKHKLKPRECMVVGDNDKEDILIPKRLGFITFKINRAEDLRLLVV